MVTKTTTRPTPRSSQSHSHTNSQSSRNSSSKTTTPAGRVSASVGQNHPPTINSSSLLRTPNASTIPEDVRTPSPNYFGLAVNPTTDPRDSGAPHKNNWSPPTSSIQSFGVNTPQHLPLDSNPEFALFRRQTEEGAAFNLGHGNLSHFASTPGGNIRPKDRKQPVRTHTSEHPPSPKSRPTFRDGTPDHMDVDGSQDQISPRTSLGAPSFFDIPRQQSPVPMALPAVQRNVASTLDDRHPRLSLPQNKADPPSPRVYHTGHSNQRADTLPPSLEEGPVLIAPSRLRDMLDSLPSSDYLLIDLRVFPQFAASRIEGALNLCIPTTLLKRPSFNLKKLQDTFATEAEKIKFSKWASAKYIVVYDAFSDEKRDAVSAINTLKKFSNEGWQGHSYIVRGGFAAFSKEYPKLVDTRSSQDMQSSKVSLSLSGPGVAPVAGGCAMPATKNAANPFFSNIRQNQDLIGGVGLMDVKVPEELVQEGKNILPAWLLEASAKEDKGHKVSDKFLKLELAEQSRMTKALASGVSYGTPRPGSKDVQIAGIEKGSKNRYNNIWPFEHARVRLQGRPEGACDYVNASHVKARRSNKQYIASQGPLPATFEDFWSVIWDHDVRVIVMLTAESEGGQLKCHPYWASREYGPLKLKALSEKKVSLDTKRRRAASTDHRDSGRKRAATTVNASPVQHQPATVETPHAIVRKFTLAHSSHPFSPMREITQIHYSSWPDFGAPASPAHLLGLVELSNSLQKASAAPTQSTRSDEPENAENPRPVLVHCSAGCGRTGTFCTIDSVIDMLKRQRKEIKSGITPMEGLSSGDDYMGSGKTASSAAGDWVFSQDTDLIEKTVEDFRSQRLSMVQSLRQYVLCYETVLEWIAQQRLGPPKARRTQWQRCQVNFTKTKPRLLRIKRL